MNKENIQKAINIMKRAGKVNMTDWQKPSCIVCTEEEANLCGTAACFAGWVALSTEFQADGGWVSHASGIPLIEEHSGQHAIAYWLGISLELAEALCACVCLSGTSHIALYGKTVHEITKEDVIEQLEILLNA